MESQVKEAYIIAEAGINHNGDLDIARRLVIDAFDSGCDAIKFQSFNPDEFIGDRSLMITYQDEKGRVIEESQYEFFKRVMLPDDWHFELSSYCKEIGIDFLSSAADPYYVDILEKLNVPYIKIASEDIINYKLLKYLGLKKIPVILSTGMADEDEIRSAINLLKGSRHIILLHCVSSYPTKIEEANVLRMVTLKEKFGMDVGYSDHTIGTICCLAAATLGARIIEKHFTLDKNMEGPDHKIALNPGEMKDMVVNIRDIGLCKGNGELKYRACEEEGREKYRRTIVASRDLFKGNIISTEDLDYKRTGRGLHPRETANLIGKKLNCDKRFNEIIEMGDVL